jgi:hypothetical protein
MSNIKIIDIKDQAEGLKIQYEADGNLCSLSSGEMPADTFVEALDALKCDVLAILKLPKDYGNGMTVTGIHLSRKNGEEGENVKVIIKAKKELDAAVWAINTPNRCIEATTEGDSMLPDATIDRINRLCRQAILYVKGNRVMRSLYQQQELDFEAEVEALASQG